MPTWATSSSILFPGLSSMHLPYRLSTPFALTVVTTSSPSWISSPQSLGLYNHEDRPGSVASLSPKPLLCNYNSTVPYPTKASTKLTCSHIYILRYHHAPYSQTRGSVIAIESHTSIVDVPT
ncbi:hypothetical protein QCA50_010854 [Cerrena zonata]|uniref:Uncharacterized protein n=1 Tax=Cerrena zonata TaxID=2478898 RepID=A0AAW0G3E0_9APHY